MQIDEKALVRAVKRAMERAGTMPAKDAVKLVPADWHRICDLVLKSAKQKGEAEGWVLVPREPTNEMLWANAGTSDTHKPTWNRAMWAAFLAAAPEPPTMLSAGG